MRRIDIRERIEFLAGWLVLAIALALAPDCIAQPAQGAQGQSGAFESAKALGRQRAREARDDLNNGRSEAAVRDAVGGYSSNPGEASAYASQDGAGRGSSLAERCRGDSTTAQCSAVNLGRRKLDLSATRPSDPALDGQAAVARPELVLGDIARTYNACSVGGGVASPASWSPASCRRAATDWAEYGCSKTLDLRPIETSSCVDKTVVVTGRAAGGSWSASVQGWCSLPTGAKPMRFDVELPGQGCGAFARGYTVDIDLHALPADPSALMQLSSVSVIGADGACKQLLVYVEGPGCNDRHCKLGMHFTTEPYETVYVCPVGVIGTDIPFQPPLPRASAKLACFDPFLDRETAEAALGPRLAASGLYEGPGDSGRFWVHMRASTFSHIEWPGDHAEVKLDYVLPRVFPAAGDQWANFCASLEEQTPGLPPDGRNDATLPLLAPPARAGRAQCVRRSSTCTDGPSTRVIDGVPVTRECWAYHNVFACATSADADCEAARDTRCAPAGPAACSAEDRAGHCLDSRQPYACRAANAALQPAVNCGDASFCLEGSCWRSDDTENRPNRNYAAAMGQFQARADAGASTEVEPLRVHVFKGRALQCKIGTFGLDDCCADAALTTRCSAEEVERKRLSDAGRCIDVGSYCARRTIFGCRERRTGSCCYNSLLGRLIQEQGRSQLGKDFGDARAPDCGGLTPEELAAIDWSRLDLSEYFAQLQLDPKAIDPDAAKASTDASQGSCYYGSGRC